MYGEHYAMAFEIANGVLAMTQRSETISTMILDLDKEERLLAEADEALGRALAKYRLAAARYVAVRDSIAEYLGGSPYLVEYVSMWPGGDEAGPWEPPHGQYRFLNKDPGVAVSEVLMEHILDAPGLNLQAILEEVKKGGLKEINGKPIDGRTINAVLQTMKNISKNADGRYSYVLDDDLPF